jgi:hypothetical protein
VWLEQRIERMARRAQDVGGLVRHSPRSRRPVTGHGHRPSVGASVWRTSVPDGLLWRHVRISWTAWPRPRSRRW